MPSIELFPPASRTILSDQVANAMRAAIASGALPPGSRIVESDVAEKMGMSKAPVREALRLLESEGLITSSRHRGSFVTQLSPDDVEEIFAMRSALERLAVGLLVDRNDQEAVSQLRKVLEEIREAESAEDFERLSDADFNFHYLIVHHCGNRRVDHSWQEIRGLVKMLVLTKMLKAERDAYGIRVVDSSHQHEIILEAIERGDRAGAQALLEQHVTAGGQRLAGFLRETQAGVDSLQQRASAQR